MTAGDSERAGYTRPFCPTAAPTGGLISASARSTIATLPRVTDTRVAATFARYPAAARARVLALRDLIFATAERIDGVGAIEETLKWGEPAYLTSETKSGTTVRLAYKDAEPDRYRLLVHCQTSLIDTFRTLHPELEYEGDRAIVFAVDEEPPIDAVAHCIEMALTYHRR